MIVKNKYVSLNIPNVGLGSNNNSKVTFKEGNTPRQVERIQTEELHNPVTNALINKNLLYARVNN